MAKKMEPMTGFEPATYSLRVKFFEGKMSKCGGFCGDFMLYYKYRIRKSK